MLSELCLNVNCYFVFDFIHWLPIFGSRVKTIQLNASPTFVYRFLANSQIPVLGQAGSASGRPSALNAALLCSRYARKAVCNMCYPLMNNYVFSVHTSRSGIGYSRFGRLCYS